MFNLETNLPHVRWPQDSTCYAFKFSKIPKVIPVRSVSKFSITKEKYYFNTIAELLSLEFSQEELKKTYGIQNQLSPKSKCICTYKT